MPTIKFTDITGLVPEVFYPTPAKKSMPEWLKNLLPYYDFQGKEEQTAKRCLPLLDSVMLGYTIFATADIRITQTEGDPYFEWSHGRGIQFHAGEQTLTYSKTRFQTPKWMNPWSIETPKGYSCLIVSPLNHDNLPFQIFAGVVETDNYIAPINLPFNLTNPKYEGIVDAGTPIAQVFPFQREEWESVISVGTTRDIEQVRQTIASVFKNGYRKFFRQGMSFD